ncbi:glycosyltransferase family protein [Nonlabens xiamenensis]|uniref:glycosyltransferase family protein n=1 Tax=Nonlabens xiamenensis TaxID=2341043 RepID=UPI000F6055D9|nr:glycosyltransferase [Nonlabens xiamenensis]
MRILLVGEYSGFHNSLKHGLELLGHEVCIIGDGDGFKGYPVDIDISSQFFRKYWLTHKLKVAWWKLTGHNLEDRLKYVRFRESEHQIQDYDIVQFINSNAFNCNARTERKMIDRLLKIKARFFLVACGDDYEYTRYLTETHQGYSILESVKNGDQQQADFQHTFKYLQPEYRDNYEHIVNAASQIIPSNVDYAMALTQQPKATDIIPAPINCAKFPLDINADFSIIQIFLGINRANYWKKGINYFEQALNEIKRRYPDKVRIHVVENVPYAAYIKKYHTAHILLDQVLCYDQGYNALEAMLQGKVVFSGGSESYLKGHGFESVPVIDARPDVDYLIEKISHLIEHPEDLLKIGKAARNHVLEHHESLMIAQRYEALYTAATTHQ